MKTANNIKKISLILFLIIGTIHITSGLMFANGYLMPTSMIINRVMDIPFAMTALIYAFMNIYTNINEKYRKISTITMGTITLLIFIILLYINLFIPDKSSLITSL